MAATAHARFGASSAKRLIACPASYTLTEQLDVPDAPTVWRAEGTLAHQIAETCILDGSDPRRFVGTAHLVEGFELSVDSAFTDHVDVFVDYVRGLQAVGYHVVIERRVSPSWIWAPVKPPIDLFGTADVIAYHPQIRHVVIVDLKFGAGVAVEADDNEQLRYYGLGAIEEVKRCWPGSEVASVNMTIVQPRAPHAAGAIRTQEMTVEALTAWGQLVLKPAVYAVLEPKAPIKSGDHCRFCPVRAQCPELHRLAQSTAATVFDDTAAAKLKVEEFDAAELGTLLDRLDTLDAWIDGVRQHAHQRLEAGGEIDGWKLVPKRATRKWDHEFNVSKILDAFGVPEHECHDTKLKSPAQMLALPVVKRSPHIQNELQQHITSQSSGTTLARAGDARPAVSGRPAAAVVFND